jgi:hypothetical protein
MAEFTEVIKQAKRICNIYGTDEVQYKGCPLNSHNGCIFYDGFECDDTYFIKIEKYVMDWAKENPEIVYPSWEDAWKQIFPNGIDTPCPSEYDAKYGHDCLKLSCLNCKRRSIPAEVAEKLGIRPKEGM